MIGSKSFSMPEAGGGGKQLWDQLYKGWSLKFCELNVYMGPSMYASVDF